MLFKNGGKRLVSVVCALVLVLTLSVPSSALVREFNYNDLPPNILAFLLPYSGSGLSDAYQMNVKFEGANAAYNTTANREAWKMVMGEWLNDPNYKVFFFYSVTYFFVYAAPTSAISSTSTNFKATEGYTFQFYLGSSGSDKQGVLYKAIKGAWESPTSYADSVGFYFFDNGIRSVLESVSSRYYGVITDMQTFVVKDDVREDEPDPEPPSSSEPDEPTISPPKEPEVPAGNPEYVVYNTSIWLTFFRWVRRHIGNAVFVGFLVLAAIMGIYLILRIIKHYSRQ